ncbi:hypothetical protein OA88_17430 [Flavobacterium sp. JRM]|nr:hypothetical protein OA88_17430 [Flavobacterium sp. JRM]
MEFLAKIPPASGRQVCGESLWGKIVEKDCGERLWRKITCKEIHTETGTINCYCKLTLNTETKHCA